MTIKTKFAATAETNPSPKEHRLSVGLAPCCFDSIDKHGRALWHFHAAPFIGVKNGSLGIVQTMSTRDWASHVEFILVLASNRRLLLKSVAACSRPVSMTHVFCKSL